MNEKREIDLFWRKTFQSIMDQCESIEFTNKLKKVTNKIMDNRILIFSTIDDDRMRNICREVLVILGAEYTSVKGMDEIIKSSSSTALQKKMAEKNLNVLAAAMFLAINFTFNHYQYDLRTSVMDPEWADKLLPEEFKGLGGRVMKIHSELPVEEKRLLGKESNEFLWEEEQREKKKLWEYINQ